MKTHDEKQFTLWYQKYKASAKGIGRAVVGKGHGHAIPTFWVSAEDYVTQFSGTRYKPVEYDWSPSPITSSEAKAIKKASERVTIETENTESVPRIQSIILY